VRKRGLAEQISVRKGNGLAVIQPNEVEVITISGMGGGTMRDILSAGEDKLAGVSRLVLSPQGDSDQLRRWLLAHGWKIIDEDMLVEDERIYEFVVCERGDMVIEDPAVLEFGPFLLERKHPLIIERADYELGKIRRALPALENAKGESGEKRREELLARRAMLEEVKTRVQS
jgi:tRNA (adenine22-N1)-methyltransferase